MADLGKVRDALDVVTIERLLTDGDLEPVILRRIVAAGDHDPAVHVKSKQGIVEGRRGHDTDVDDIGTLARHTIDKRISKVLAAGPHVTADRKGRRARASPLSHKVNVRLSDTPGCFRRQFLADLTPDVVPVSYTHLRAHAPPPVH